MNTQRLCFIVSFLLLTILAKGQKVPPNSLNFKEKGQVTGTLLDSTTRQAVPFASVALLSETGAIVAGQTTTEAGHFTFAGLDIGNYGVQITYVGYQPRTLTGLSLRPVNPAGTWVASCCVPKAAN